MMPTTLAGIRDKVRRVTARTSNLQLSDDDINNYINTVLLYDFPEIFRLQKLKESYRFQTVPNIDTYDLPLDTYLTFEPPAYVAGQPVAWFQEPDAFYRSWPKINYIQQLSSGNGGVGPYTGTVTNTPFLRSVNPSSVTSSTRNVIISANTSFATATTAYDDGNGGFVGASGTIDYQTGSVSITFDVAIPFGNAINIQVIPYVASMPRSFLLFQSQLVFRPVPDQAYEVQMTCYRRPIELLEDASSPELLEWGQAIAYGAALKIFADYGDMEQLAAVRPLYDEQLILINRRTLVQLRNQRAATIYTDQNNYPFGNYYPYI
jgi:hypothetical protein